MTLWVATFRFVNVLQEMFTHGFAQSEAVHEITFRTQRPDIKSGKNGKHKLSAQANEMITDYRRLITGATRSRYFSTDRLVIEVTLSLPGVTSISYSPYDFNTLSSRQVMRIKKIIS